MNIGPLLARLRELETALARHYRSVGERHAADHDVFHLSRTLAAECERHAERLTPLCERYADGSPLWGRVVGPGRPDAEGGLALLEDLRALFLAAEETSITWVMAGQAAKAARDAELLAVVNECHPETEVQVKWLVTRIKTSAPQALVTG